MQISKTLCNQTGDLSADEHGLYKALIFCFGLQMLKIVLKKKQQWFILSLRSLFILID